MGQRTLIDMVATGINNEYKKIIPDLEARIRVITEGGSDYSLGSANGSLANSEYYFDYTTKTLYIKTSDGSNPSTKVIVLYTYYQAYGTWATQAEMAALEQFQKFTATANFYIRYVRIFIMKKGSPIFTNLTLSIHPELSNYPTEKVLATSENTFDNTVNNANTLSEIWFRFDHYGIKNGDSYCLVLTASGTFDNDNHIAWVNLDPVYSDGLPNDTNQIVVGSKRFVIIGTSP